MIRISRNLWPIAALFCLCGPAQAVLIGVSGEDSRLGASARIIDAPGDVTEDAHSNFAQTGFDEQLGVLLTDDLEVDYGRFIDAGTMVDSHMIHMNTGPGDVRTRNLQRNVEWVFDGLVLGVMSDLYGWLEFDSNSLLGLSTTLYPDRPMYARGLEGRDGYDFQDNRLLLTMRVTEPGDWIRVITASNVTAVPEPGTLVLLSLGLLVAAPILRRRRNA